MRRRTTLAIAVALTCLVGATGTVTAQPADGPPDEPPDPVPEFVGDVLGAVSDFVGGALESLDETVRSLTPGDDAAGPNGDDG